MYANHQPILIKGKNGIEKIQSDAFRNIVLRGLLQ